MIRLELHGIDEVATLIDGLLEAAERWEPTRPLLAKKYVRLANTIGDELDLLPNPSAFRAGVETKRARHIDALAG